MIVRPQVEKTKKFITPIEIVLENDIDVESLLGVLKGYHMRVKIIPQEVVDLIGQLEELRQHT